MLVIESKYHYIQAFLIYKGLIGDLEDSNIVNLVVHLVKLFEKENSELFKGKPLEFRVQNSGMINLKYWDHIFFLLLDAIDLAVRLKLFLTIKSKPACTLLMINYLENQKINQL